MAKPVTREEKENSKREFDELNHLINNELKGLEGWLLKSAQPKLTNLQKLLRGDMTDQDTRWECEAEIWIAKTLTKQGQSKIDYIDNLVTNLNDQVLRAPIKIKDTDEDTSESRLYQARAIDAKIEESKEAFDRWTNSILMIQANFKELTEKKDWNGKILMTQKRIIKEDQEMTKAPPVMPKVSNLMSSTPPCPNWPSKIGSNVLIIIATQAAGARVKITEHS